MKHTRKHLSLVLAFIMVLSLVPAYVFEQDRTYATGEAGDTGIPSVRSPSEITYDTRVSYELVSIGKTGEAAADTHSAVVRFSLENPGELPVTFDYAAVSGSAETGKHLTGIISGTVSLSQVIHEVYVTIDIAPFADNPNTNGIPNSPNNYWTGERIFYLYCNDITNALFENDRSSVTIPVPIESGFDYQTSYDTASAALLVDLDQVDGGENGVYPIPADNTLSMTGFVDGDVRKMIDAGVFSHIQLPDGYFANETGEPTSGDIQYRITLSRKTDGSGDTLDAYTYTITLNDTGKTPFYSADHPQEVPIAQVGLGPGPEGNGVFKRLDLTLDYSTVSDHVYTYFLDDQDRYMQYQVSLSDELSPGVKSSSIGMANVRYGDDIPVIITFNEPVHTDNISFEVGGKTLSPLEKTGTISESVSFLYHVEDTFVGAGSIGIAIDNIDGAVDLSGKGQESIGSANASGSFDTFDARRAFAYCAEPEITLDQGTSPNMQGTINIPIKRDGDLSNWLYARKDANDISTVVKARVIDSTDTAVDVPLALITDLIGVTELTGSFTLPENTTEETLYYGLEIYLDSGSGYELVYNLTTVYAVPSLILIDEASDLSLDYANWPSGNSISVDSATALALGYILHVDATWKDAEYFQWSSSDNNIATIDASGVITLTGASGTVSFTLTVTNPLSVDLMTFESHTLTVHAAEDAYLYIPSALTNLDILKGSSPKVSFSSNLTVRNAVYGGAETETTFTVHLYKANYEDYVPEKGETLLEQHVTATEESPIASYTVPAELLQTTTPKGTYGYILEISGHDLQSGQTLTTAANIRLRELPAKAVLAEPDTMFFTDNTRSLSLQFDIENKNSATEYLMTVIKNSQTEPILKTSSAADIGRSLVIGIDTVGASRLLDVYTISLKAKNPSDETWSYDSYTVYVYNSNAMKILVKGFPYGGMTLNLKPNLEDGDIFYTTDILRYRSDLGLSSSLSINSYDYPWSAIADKVTWSVEGDSVSLRYEGRQIVDDHSPVLLPGTVISLRGEQAGSAAIIASHTLTDMTASQQVTVDPVNKLYLFQAYPQVSCEIVYTNGNGVTKTLEAVNGQLGVYEESGISSDVHFYPTGSAEAVYGFAVLSHSQLTANQNTSAGAFDLYPLNTVKLPETNYYVSLSLFNEETNVPYTGDLVIRGGLYLNDSYRQATTINGQMGNADQTVSADEMGIYTLSFRPADVTSRLRATDELKYVIEIVFKDNSHMSKFITIENDAIQAGRQSPQGVSLNVGIKELNPSSIQNKAVVLEQSLFINTTRQPLSEVFYLEEPPEVSSLNMLLMFSDHKDRNYQLQILDSTGAAFGSAGIVDATRPYPFSDTVMFKSITTVSTPLAYMLNHVLDPGEKGYLYPVIKSTDGNLEIKLSKPIQVQSFYKMPSMGQLNNPDSEFKAIHNLLANISATSASGNFSFSANSIVKEAMNYANSFAVKASTIGLEIKPTSDPLVYKGAIRYAVGNYSKYNPSGLYLEEGNKATFQFLPNKSENKPLSKSDFSKISKEEMSRKTEKVYGGGAYIDCEIYFSVAEQKWNLRVLQGDVYIGGGGVYFKNYNGWISFVPVTATFRTTLTTELGLKILRSQSGNKTAYIPRIRPVFSVYGFGGVGRDYKVASLKAGVYGVATHEQLYLWYRDSDGATANGQRLTLSGEVGVKYEIKVAVLVNVSGKYVLTKTSTNWKFNKFDKINNLTPAGLGSFAMFSAYDGADADTIVFVPVEEVMSFEDRSYLTAFDRSWSGASSPIGRFARSSDDGLKSVWTNAYPYANPSMTDDGAIMTYLSDMDSTDLEDTEALFTVKDADGSFPEGIEIDQSEYPDDDLSVAGTIDGASAVWVRSYISDIGDAGDEASIEDVLEPLAASEVMAGFYKDGAFTTTRLTNNDNPDLSPVTATSNGKAIAAWRSVTLGDLEDSSDFTSDYNPFNFTSDYLMFSIYDGSSWSAAKYLYDGSIDNVHSFNAAMLPDGRSAVVYQTVKADGGNSEIFCAILDPSGEVIQTIRLTANETADENPQITTAEFPDGTIRFVVGWNAKGEDEQGTVYLVAINGDGTLYTEFGLELADNSGATSYANFRFTKGTQKIEDLSVLWTEPEYIEGGSEEYAETIWGTKLVKTPGDPGSVDDPGSSGGQISLTGKLKLLTLDSGRTIDSLDARVDPETGKLHFAMLLSEPTEEATLVTAVAEYQNMLTLAAPSFQYTDLLPGLTMPIGFTAKNDGIDPITQINIVLDEQNFAYENQQIMPGATKEFVIFYQVPDTVADADYTVTAQFASAATDEQAGTIKFALPDVGIKQIDLTKETQRERGFRILLQNGGFTELQPAVHTVKLEVWDTPDFEDEDGQPLKTLSISDEHLSALNNSLLPVDVLLTEADLQGILNEDGEIPVGGSWIFFRTVLLENGVIIEDADISNDMDYAKVYSLIERNGAMVSLASFSEVEDGKTAVHVEALNHSMNTVTKGNIVVTLRDERGNVLETRQTYDPGNTGSLLSIGGETSETASLLFDGTGHRIDATFARVSEGSTLLSSLNLTGINLSFDQNIYEYTLNVWDLKETLITALAENPDSIITVTHNGTAISLTSPCTLVRGTNTFVITVTTGTLEVAYTITVRNETAHNGGDSSGGDGSDSGSSSYGGSSTTYYANLAFGTGSQTLNIYVSDGNALIDLGSLAQDIFTSDTITELRIPAIPGVTSYTLQMPASALIGYDSNAILNFVTVLGSMNVHAGMLSSMIDLDSNMSNLDGKLAGITIEAADITGFPEQVMNAIGNRPLLRLTLTIDGQQTPWQNRQVPITVSIPYAITSGELLNPESIVIWYIDSNNNLITIPDGVYDSVTGFVTFTTTHFSHYGVGFNRIHYADVPTGSWYEKAVSFIAAREITSGTGDGKYSPNQLLTRGQLIVLLMRAYGIEPDNQWTDNFSDAGNTYYTSYLAAAKRLEIAKGIGDNRFAPDNTITRQEMFTLLYNILREIERLPQGNSNKKLADFSDANEIAAWAKDSMTLLVESGKIIGNDGKLSPTETTTRAEMAQVLYNLLSQK